jgi:hypothetical protein
LLISSKGDFMQTGWGGTRSGSGRKEIPVGFKKRGYTFQLADDDITFIESFEGNNRSESLRNMIKEFRLLKKQIDFSKLE